MRSLKQQFNYCISKSAKTGQSKHSAKKNGTYKHGNLYGNLTIQAYRDCAKNLCNFLNDNYPEITEIRQITQEHIQAWINDRSKNWSARTLENHITHIKYLEKQAKEAYPKSGISFYKENLKKPTITKETTRDKAFTDRDFNLLRNAMKDSKSFAKDAIEISYRAGLRVNEVAHLKAADIDIKNKTIYISREGAKNGRARTVPIRDQDLQYFKELKEKYPEGYMCNVKTASINKTIRRYMKDTKDEHGKSLDSKYKNTTDHAIRKLYATNRMKELRGAAPLPDFKQEMKVWDTVSRELGHGAGRENLYRTYCKG